MSKEEHTGDSEAWQLWVPSERERHCRLAIAGSLDGWVVLGHAHLYVLQGGEVVE